MINMIITATEFKNKVGKFIEIAKKEDIIISKNGKNIVKIVSVGEDEYPSTQSLLGVFEKAAGYDINKTKEERLSKYENID
jgi:prevent-host-death family protein